MKLLFGDCFEHFRSIEEGSVDFILADPPFGTTACSWDSRMSCELLWEELHRLLAPQGVIALHSAQPFTTDLIQSNLKEFKYCWYWVKNVATNFFHAKRMPLRKLEEICIFGGTTYFPQMSSGHKPTHSAKGSSTGNTYHGKNIRDYQGGSTQRYPTNILNFKCVNNKERVHSSQKPVELLEYLIKTYTQEGDLILDFCMGSGSTGVASLKLGRDFIGIELEEKSFDIAKERITCFSA